MKKIYKLMGCVMASTIMITGCNGITASNVTNPTQPEPSVPVAVEPGVVTSETKMSEAPISNNTVFVTDKNIKFTGTSDINDYDKISELSDASLDLFSELSKMDTSDNVLISPLSIQMALGMTENGAKDKTLDEMEDKVNGGLSVNDMNDLMASYYARLTDADEVDWDVANSIWFKNDGVFALKEKFLETVRTHYNSEVALAPFDESTVTDINAWVNNNTRGMIPDILDKIPDNVQSYLVNAVAFEGEWMDQYEDSDIWEERDFTNADGSTSKVTMLCSSEGRYFKLGEGQGFVKQYKGGEFAFVGILPDEGVTPQEYISDLADKDLDLAKAVREAEYKEVVTQIPEFSYDYKTDLSNTYMAMGMNTPFTRGEADFSDMMETTSGDPYMTYIGRILHKTHIEVDRKGTKAAAATAVEMFAEGCAIDVELPEYVILDRPFVYAIVDTETGMPVFIGYQNSMN